jgi:quercetin dioxygenase-like cupin family protein
VPDQTVTTADGLLVVGPGGGDAFPTLDIVRKASASDTGGWGVVVVTGYPGEGGRTHVHDGEAEAFFILDGPVDLLGAESVTRLETGAFVLVPPGVEHGLRMVGEGVARWLAIWPSALDRYPEAAEALNAAGAGPDAMTDLRRRHGILPGRQR